MKIMLIYMIRMYQNTLGLYFRGSCRFNPTCSQYMIIAIQKYGILIGVSKGIQRLLKCHPYSKHQGVDSI